MANPEHLAKLKEGVQTWNEWAAKLPHFRPDLSDAELSGAILGAVHLTRANLTGAHLTQAILSRAVLSVANLTGADLSRAKLSHADLSAADLSAADLSRAILVGANLSRADLHGANLGGANLIGANLSAANLSEADFNLADLRGANLGGANVARTRFTSTRSAAIRWSDVDLSETVNLESITHLAPSTVGIDTLAKSKGRIPDAFLRGCGVPEHIIGMQKSLVGDISPIQFYSCFISYSHKDEEFCRRLHARMQQEGLRVWFAPEEMKGGRKLHDQIDEAIRLYDKLLLVLSEASMRSDWVGTEIRKARKRERSDKRQVLFPIRLVDFEAIRDWERFDADSGKDVACEIREYFIPDFSNWKNHDDFEAGFGRLLKDLKASA